METVPPNSRGNRAGTADPAEFRFHRAAGSKTDTLKAGAALVNAAAVQCVLAIAGSPGIRLRGLFTAGGTMAFYYLRPGSVRAGNTTADAYPNTIEPPHNDKAVVADTGFSVDITPVGESDLLCVFTPAADGAVTYFDVCPL